MPLYPAVDSNALTYLLDAIAVEGYDPVLDAGELAMERLAMARCFFHGDCSPWVPPTARTEYQKITSLEKREIHRRWTQYHLQDRDLDVSDVIVQRRVEELLLHHQKVNDCRVVAETEFARLQVLLTVDRDMRLRLQAHTNVKILLPSEFWSSLGITCEPNNGLRPAWDNPLYGKSWWRLPARKDSLDEHTQ